MKFSQVGVGGWLVWIGYYLRDHTRFSLHYFLTETHFLFPFTFSYNSYYKDFLSRVIIFQPVRQYLQSGLLTWRQPNQERTRSKCRTNATWDNFWPRKADVSITSVQCIIVVLSCIRHIMMQNFLYMLSRHYLIITHKTQLWPTIYKTWHYFTRMGLP